VHRSMEWWTQLRVRQAHEPVSKRALCREEGVSYKTLQKALSHSEPLGYRLGWNPMIPATSTLSLS
jgi:hypothetical protein